MEEIMRYSTFLEGARDSLSEDEIKTILFTLFPVAWQINYKQSQLVIQRTPIEDIMIFISQEKEFSDHNNKQSSRWQEHGGDGGQGRG